MKYINCPLCGKRLLEGSEGSRVVIKCGNCNKLLDAEISQCGISITVRDNSISQPTVVN